MGLVLAFAILAIVLFGLGFAVKWLFILAVLAVIVAIVLGVTGRSRGSAL
jgi:hypothetical protein